MSRATLFLLLAELLAGCSEIDLDTLPRVDCPTHTSTEEVEKPPGADAAADLVWGAYGLEAPRPKDIRWVPGYEFAGKTAGKWGAKRGLRCRGNAHESLWVAIRGGRPSETSLAHELTHSYIGRLGVPDQSSGWGDPEHTRPEWKAIEYLNDWLASEGF